MHTVMLQTVADQTQILQDLHNEGYPVDSADLAYLSPYVTEQLKRFGEYSLAMKRSHRHPEIGYLEWVSHS